MPTFDAWVTQRGGLLGIGSKRIMGIGLPMLQALSVAQLRAVLAHEFGHYYGGDTKLAPFLYQTRGAMVRTVQNMDIHDHSLQRFFLMYAQLFMDKTLTISRRQEFVADQLAAHVAGSGAVIASLRRTHGAAPAYDQYWRNVVMPVIKGNKLPPISEGFCRYIARSDVAARMERTVEDDVRITHAAPFDTHPVLADRLAALADFPAAAPAPTDARSANALLSNLADLERQLMGTVYGAKVVANWEAISWDVVGTSAYIPQWLSELRRQADILKGVTPLQLPEIAQNMAAFGGKLHTPPGRIAEMGLGEMRGLAGRVLGMGIAVALYRRDWQVNVAPGQTPVLSKGDQTTYPFLICERLATKKLDPDDWARQCQKWGIAEVDFGALSGGVV